MTFNDFLLDSQMSASFGGHQRRFSCGRWEQNIETHSQMLCRERETFEYSVLNGISPSNLSPLGSENCVEEGKPTDCEMEIFFMHMFLLSACHLPLAQELRKHSLVSLVLCFSSFNFRSSHCVWMDIRDGQIFYPDSTRAFWCCNHTQLLQPSLVEFIHSELAKLC